MRTRARERIASASLVAILVGSLHAQEPKPRGLGEMVAAGRLEDALRLLEERLEQAPENVELFAARGAVLERLERFEEARADYRRVVELRPDRRVSWSRLGVLEHAAGRLPAAIDALSEALRLAPCRNDDRLFRAALFLMIDDPAAAIGDLDALRECGAERPEEPALRAEALFALGRGQEAQQLIMGSYRDADLESKLARLDRLRDLAVGDTAPTALDSAAGSPVAAHLEIPGPPPVEFSDLRREEVAVSPATTSARERSARIAALAESIRSWARAWSRRDVDAYLDHYHSVFSPEEGSQENWRRERRARLRAAGYVRVRLGPIESVLLADDRAVARFQQTYESDTFRDVVAKTLEMVWDGERWKIARERTTEAAPPVSSPLPSASHTAGRLLDDIEMRQPPAGDPAASLTEPAGRGGDPALSGPEVLTSALRAEITAAVESWLRAWSRQNVDVYFGSYSHRFVPPVSVSRDEWRASRLQRLLAPSWLEVSADTMSVEVLEGGVARVRLRQSYRSDLYQDVTDKTLELEREDGAWRITVERTGF